MVWGLTSSKFDLRSAPEVESESISFMVHASHAGAEFPGDFQKQAWCVMMC